MSTIPYKVCIVVDPDFGQRLATLPAGVPVWIVDTPANTPVAHRLWRERKQENHLTGITTFRIEEGSPPAENLLRELPAIDLHHGPESAKPPYTEIEVFGAAISDEIRLVPAEYGFEEFSAATDGFWHAGKLPKLSGNRGEARGG